MSRRGPVGSGVSWEMGYSHCASLCLLLVDQNVISHAVPVAMPMSHHDGLLHFETISPQVLYFIRCLGHAILSQQQKNY